MFPALSPNTVLHLFCHLVVVLNSILLFQPLDPLFFMFLMFQSLCNKRPKFTKGDCTETTTKSSSMMTVPLFPASRSSCASFHPYVASREP